MYIAKTLIIFSILCNFNNNNNVINDEFWLTDYELAVKKAKEEQKIIMLYFSGSDWCKPCIIWKREVFDSEAFHYYASSKVVPVKLDFPRQKKNKLPKEEEENNNALAAKFNNGGVFPFIVFLDLNEKVIGKTDYRKGGTSEFIKYVDSVLAQKQ